MSDQQDFEPMVAPMLAPHSLAPQAQNWHVNEISAQEQSYLVSHHELASDFTLAYQPDSREVQSAIAAQMQDLGDKLDGVMSWLSLFDSSAQKAQITVIDFVSKKDIAARAAAQPQGLIDDAPASTDAEQNEDVVATHPLSAEAKAAMKQCAQDHLPQLARLVNVSRIPRDLEDLKTMMANRKYGLAEDAPHEEYVAAVNASSAEDIQRGNAYSPEEEAKAQNLDMREYGMPAGASESQLWQVKKEFDQLSFTGCIQQDSN